jgi:hypothetical protein
MTSVKDVAVAGMGGAVAAEAAWSKFRPKTVDSARVMNASATKKAWEGLYAKWGVASASEDVKKEVRCGLYMYAFKNGTSRAGGYTGDFVVASGKACSASEVPRVVGEREIRRFMRANGDESYDFLKWSGAVEMDNDLVAVAAAMGVSPRLAFALADWFEDNPKLTAEERAVQDQGRTFNLERSRRARGGRSLEDVEGAQRQLVLRAQGPGIEPSTPGEIVAW